MATERGVATISRRHFLAEAVVSGCAAAGSSARLRAQSETSGVPHDSDVVSGNSAGGKTYDTSLYLLHLDYHTSGTAEVGRDCDAATVEAYVRRSMPDIVQIHAKGGRGWTTYPSAVGHTPPLLARDVLEVWRDAATQIGAQFFVYFNIGKDDDLHERHPEWMRVDAEGKIREHIVCYNSGIGEAYIWPMIDEIMRKYEPRGLWFDAAYASVRTCYCAGCTERFRKSHHAAPPRSPSEAGWDAFKDMHRQITRDFLAATAARVKMHDRTCRVAMNWGSSTRVPEAPASTIDYLTGDDGHTVDKISPDACWYDSQGRPFDIMTAIWWGPEAARTPKSRAQIEQEIAITIANGGRYFAWDTPSAEGGLHEECAGLLGDVVAPFLRARQPWCFGTRRPDASLYLSATAHYALYRNGENVFPEPDFPFRGGADPFISAHDRLRKSHINHEMLNDARLEKLDVASGLVVVEDPRALDPSSIAALRNYVTEGGTLLITGEGAIHPDMADVIGVRQPRYAKAVTPCTVTIDGRALVLSHRIHRIRPDTATVLLSGTIASRSGVPLMTRNTFGRGTAYGVFFPLFTEPKRCAVPTELVEDVLAEVLPEDKRLVVTDAPSTLSLILREKDGRQVLHLVNEHPGTRTFADGDADRIRRWKGLRISDIPPVSAFHVSLLMPERPRSVALQPQGIELTSWRHVHGRLEVDIPAFDLHAMLVIH